MNPKYQDMLDMPHHRSKTHPPMSDIARAAQFAPFAALTGHEEAIEETGRLTGQRIELTESEKQRLDEKLTQLLNGGEKSPLVLLTYFEKDPIKDGGRYVTKTKTIRKIDPVSKTMECTDHSIIRLQDVLDMESLQNL